ncbi:MAG TPA: hypothetical protein RMH99_19930 [Sandaracinaceae bacterium LLY-WYZ-13_1]|nr:hypothetical protein [Sandaracinaceae bacterium LLY-WYZ-13_1]
MGRPGETRGWRDQAPEGCGDDARPAGHDVGALDPNWATTGGGKKAYLEEAERYRTFQANYRVSWDRWASGDRDVVYGTWLMRVRHGARCACAEPPS